MEATKVNPWSWQEEFAYTQGWRISEPGTIVLLAGQTGVDEQGAVVHSDDFESECRLLFDNLAEVMRGAGGNLDDVFKITVYLTDINDLDAFTRVKKEFFVKTWPAQTAVGISALAVPGLRVEVDATAALTAAGAA